MTAPAIALRTAGRDIRLKWHQLRQRQSDDPFDLDNLRAGLLAGASVEVDLIDLAVPDDFLIIHGPRLDEETDASGPTSALDVAAARRLRLRHQDGTLLDRGPSLLSGLVAEVAAISAGLPDGDLHERALLQLDLKVPAQAITRAMAERFAELVRPVAKHVCVGAIDYRVVRRLAEFVPEIPRGFDPYDLRLDPRWAEERDGRWLLDTISATAPEAQIVYLPLSVAVQAWDSGFDLIPALQARGYFVDCWRLEADHPEAARALAKLAESGVNQITTNGPTEMAALWNACAAGQPAAGAT